METVKVKGREVPCPVCGYDLRGTWRVGGVARCSECGTESREAVGSRIPWVHRRYRGRVKAYLQTVWMVMRRPGALANEVNGKVRRRDAVLFQRISLVLGMVIGAAWIGLAFGLDDRPLPHVDEKSFWIVPVFVLADRWWGLVPVMVGFYVGLWMTMGGYRLILGLGAKRGVVRKKMGRIGLYVSGLVPTEAFLLGLTFFVARATQWYDAWVIEWQRWMLIGCAVCSAIAAALFLWTSWGLVIRMGRLKAVRGMAMTVLFPPVAVPLVTGTVCVMLWAAGYVAMAVWSMTQ